MTVRHTQILRLAAFAAGSIWMSCAASAQTLAAIAPVTLSPSPAGSEATAPGVAPADPAALPSDPVKAAAWQVLDTHCARCHQADKLVGKSKPSKGFGNVLDLDALAANPKYVKPGDADRSPIYITIKRREMPKDVFQDFDLDHPVPDDKDIASLRAWIGGLNKKTDVQVASLPHADEQLPSTAGKMDHAPEANDAAPPSKASTQVAARETGVSANDPNRELIVQAQIVLKRLGCYPGDPTGVVDAGTTTALARYNGIMGRGEQASAVTSDLIEELKSETGNLCASRPIEASVPPDDSDDDMKAERPLGASHPRVPKAERREARPAPHPAAAHPVAKTRVAHEPPAERKAAPQRKVAHDVHIRNPSYHQAQRAPAYHQAQRGGGGGSGGGGSSASSTVSGVNGI